MLLVFCAHFVLADFHVLNRKLKEKHSKLDFSEMADLTFMWPMLYRAFSFFHRDASALNSMNTFVVSLEYLLLEFT